MATSNKSSRTELTVSVGVIVISLCTLVAFSSTVFAGQQTREDLERKGAFAFPVGTARTHCDNDELRVQSWNNEDHLVVQAVVWNDDNEEPGETSDGRPIGDSSSLILDVNFDQKRTSEVDRFYTLNPWPQLPGLRYTIPYKGMSASSILSDSAGRGAIRYLPVADDKKVRVDTYVIPLSEIELKAGDEIGIAFLASSTTPAFVVNSIGFTTEREKYYSFDLKFKKFDNLKLTAGAEKFDVTKIPDDRELQKPVAKKKKRPIPKMGTVPPDFSAGDWLNTDTPPTLASLKGKVILVDFWSTWCSPCVAGIPHLNDLAEKHAADGLQILSFTEQSRKGIEKFQQNTAMNYPVGVASVLADEYGVTGIPHAFLIGRDGKLLWEGVPSDESFEKRVTNALSENEDEPTDDSLQQADTALVEPADPGIEFAPFAGLDQSIDDAKIYGAIYHRYKSLLDDQTLTWTKVRLKRVPKSIAGPMPSLSSDIAATLEDVVRSTVIVIGGGQDFFTAGAVLVSGDGLALTNFHVAKLQNQKLVGMTSDGKLHRITGVIAANPKHDIAIVQFEGTGFTPARIAKSPIPMGGEIEIVHHSEERFYAYERGVVMRNSIGKGVPKLEISTAYAPGGSGCGIFNANHELIGLASMLQMGQGPEIADAASGRSPDSTADYAGGYPRLVVKQAVPLSAIQMLWSGNDETTQAGNPTNDQSKENGQAVLGPLKNFDPAKPLQPGQSFYIEFPDLGETWREGPARAGVYLPRNYTADQEFPLLVWYGGGAGSDVPNKPVQITEGSGYICVAVPYRDESDEQVGGWQTPWSYYKTIFDKIEEVVPNIDPKRRIAGGASSGGAAVMFQIGNSGGAFQDYFHAFMPGMAGWPMGELETIKGRPMLAFMGELDKRLPNFRVLEKEAIAAGVDFKLLLIKGVGHKMPPLAYPEMREWLEEKVVQRDTSGDEPRSSTVSPVERQRQSTPR